MNATSTHHPNTQRYGMVILNSFHNAEEKNSLLIAEFFSRRKSFLFRNISK